MRYWLVIAISLFSATAWAQPAILDTDHLPLMQAPGARAYRERFLVGDLPRAWAIASNGAFGGQVRATTIEMARERARQSCAEKGGADCTIYAENLDVVWHGRAPAVVAAPSAPLISDRGYAFVPDARFFWRGPQSARGIIVWGHGFGGSIDDERGRQPPAFLRPLNNAGFDVVRFDRDPNWDHDIDRVVGWLRDGLRDLRQRGWRVVVTGGQSRGAWNSLAVLATPGAADVVIAASPAASGTSPGVQILRGETMFYTLADDVRPQHARLAFLQFTDDPFADNMDQRARRVRQMMAPNLDAVLLIDRPEGFKGHMGAYGPTFAETFGACLYRFVTDAKPPATCP